LDDSRLTSDIEERDTAMPKPSRAGKPWTPAEEQRLRDLAAGNTPTRVMGLKLGRSEDAVQDHASELGVSLKPTNQSPYNRRSP
jgi:hypothetical protein